MFLAGKQARNLEFENISSDEATTILASQGILRQGVPALPSGLIYWRSPASHYLNAISIAIVGDRPTGWAGASLLAYFLILVIPGILFARANRPIAGLVYVLFVGLDLGVQAISTSPRMYMAYSFFVLLAHVLATFAPFEKKPAAGKFYIAICVLAALSHQHFVLFVPGLLCIGYIRFTHDKSSNRSQWWKQPIFWAPAMGFAAALAIHFGENLLPYAFTNASSNPTALGKEAGFRFPFRAMANSWPMSAFFLFAVMLARFRGRCSYEGSGLVFAFFLALFGVAVTLPAKLPYYITPLTPVWALAVLALPAKSAGAQLPKFWGYVAIVTVLIFTGMSQNQRKISHADPLTNYRLFMGDNNSRNVKMWEILARWIKKNNALLLTSDPEVAYVRLGQFDAEVRSHGYQLLGPCEEVKENQFDRPVVHSVCGHDSAIHRSGTRPVIFVGSRLGKRIDSELTQQFELEYLRIGKIYNQKVLCHRKDEAACAELAELFRWQKAKS